MLETRTCSGGLGKAWKTFNLIRRSDIWPKVILILAKKMRLLKSLYQNQSYSLNPSRHSRVTHDWRYNPLSNSRRFWIRWLFVGIRCPECHCYPVWRTRLEDLDTVFFFLVMFNFLYSQRSIFTWHRIAWSYQGSCMIMTGRCETSIINVDWHIMLWPHKMPQKCKIKHIPIFQIIDMNFRLVLVLMTSLKVSTKIWIFYENWFTNTLSLMDEMWELVNVWLKGDKINRRAWWNLP